MGIIAYADYVRLPLTQGKVALLDKSDYQRIPKEVKWCAAASRAAKSKLGSHVYGYIPLFYEKVQHGKYRQVKLHNLIMNPSKGLVVDHINHDMLDNRRSNLRLCTRQENRFNSRNPRGSRSKLKGVQWHCQSKKWRAVISLDRKRISGGLFADEISAAKKYNELATKYHGQFAVLNSI